MATTQRRSPEYGGADLLESSYINYFSSFGIHLIPIPNKAEDVEKYVRLLQLDGLLLSGGGGVHPSFYNGEIDPQENYTMERDHTERMLLELAIRAGLPILGICRGMQTINVYFGGSLVQNIEKDVQDSIKHVKTRHRIHIVDDQTVQAMGFNSTEVNSYHNSGIIEHNLSQELQPFAIAEDGTIEGLYHPAFRLAAIMWHPEREQSPQLFNKKLIDLFKSGEFFWRKQK